MHINFSRKLVFLIGFFVVLSGAAQQETVVNESYVNKNVRFILSDLEEKYNFSVYYKSDWIDETPVSMTIENRSLLEALNYALKDQDLNVENLVDNIYVAFSNRNVGTKNYIVTLKGKVIDGNTSEPIPNAVIRLPELELATLSDLDGNYSLEFNAGTYLLTIKSLSSDLSREVRQVYENQTYDIEIFERVVELDDVVITARSQDEKPSRLKSRQGLLYS